MAQSPLLDPKLANFSSMDVASLDEEGAFWKLVELRFGDRKCIPCPHCGVIDNHYFKRTRKQWQCRERKHCGRYFSVTSNTIFADRKLPFQKILMGLALFLRPAKGVSNITMSHDLAVSYKTAFVFFGKVRELLLRRPFEVKLEGVIHADGGYFGGKPRRANKRHKPSAEEIQKRIDTGKKTLRKQDVINLQKRKNRRVILVFCEAGEGGRGPIRTFPYVATAEDQANVTPMLPKLLAKGATLHTDESPAYSAASAANFTHRTVEHIKEYSTADGVNENFAENFFSRCRRAELGVRHRMTPKYLPDFAAEMAWRQNLRRNSAKEKLADLFSLLKVDGLSRSFRGYWQGFHRTKELLQFARFV